MKVELIKYTPDAMDVLIFTKNTRLEMSASKFQDVANMPEDWKFEQLKYMANTIPSSWEFVDYIFLITGVSRAFTHQFVRTRTGSYAQQSMRVTDQKGFGYIAGPSVGEKNMQEYYHLAMNFAQGAYDKLLKEGVAIEDARGVLPTNICTNIVAKFNLRTLSEMCKSRTGGRTQNEYQQVMQGMADAVLAVHPWAELFLFPKGRDYFDALEEHAAELKKHDPEAAQNMLKTIDKMRKER